MQQVVVKLLDTNRIKTQLPKYITKHTIQSLYQLNGLNPNLNRCKKIVAKNANSTEPLAIRAAP